MYSVILLAAMTSTGPACHNCYTMPRRCCPVQHGCCGVVMFFWSVPGGTVGFVQPPSKLWIDYVEALDEPERSNVQELWQNADAAGRQKLLDQVATMHPPAKAEKDPDNTVRRSNQPSDGRHLLRNGG